METDIKANSLSARKRRRCGGTDAREIQSVSVICYILILTLVSLRALVLRAYSYPVIVSGSNVEASAYLVNMLNDSISKF